MLAMMTEKEKHGVLIQVRDYAIRFPSLTEVD
jgi:hypothetical protein